MDSMSLVYRGTVPDLVCCEAILRVLPNGGWAAFFQSGGPTEPHVDNDVFLAKSTDRGQTWSEAKRIFDIPGKPTYQTEVMVHNNKITLFVCTHNGEWMDWEEWYTVSEDNGETWSDFKPVPGFLHQNTFIRSLYVKRNGELVLPFQHYHMDAEEYQRLHSQKGHFCTGKTIRPENGVMISRDDGETWEISGTTTVDTSSWIWAENNVVELSDGTLVMLIRVDGANCLYRSDSFDGGRTWCKAYPSDIVNPGSKIRLFRLQDNRILLLHNPRERSFVRKDWGRNPLSIWISEDDMKTWSFKKDVVTFPGVLSYPDGFVDEKEKCVHFVFDYSKHDVVYVGASYE